MSNAPSAPIDVLIPVYNAELYLSEALESILSQTYQNWKMLIIDDGSTDKSLSIIQQYAKNDQRVIYRSRSNKGLVATLNELTAWSSAPYIARMDADDISAEGRLEKQIAFLKQNPNIDIVGSWVKLFGSKKETWHYRATDKQIRVVSFFGRCSLLHASLMCRRQVFDSFPFDEEFTHLEDFDFLTRIISDNRFKMAAIREPLYQYRQHPSSVVYQNELLRLTKSEEVFSRFLASLSLVFTSEERRLFDMFNSNHTVSEEVLRDIGQVVVKAKNVLTANTLDVDKEFDYRWLRFCRLNLKDELVYEYFERYFYDESFVFFECKAEYLKKNAAI